MYSFVNSVGVRLPCLCFCKVPLIVEEQGEVEDSVNN